MRFFMLTIKYSITRYIHVCWVDLSLKYARRKKQCVGYTYVYGVKGHRWNRFVDRRKPLNLLAPTNPFEALFSECAGAFFYRRRCLPWCKTLPEEASWLGTWCVLQLSCHGQEQRACYARDAGCGHDSSTGNDKHLCVTLRHERKSTRGKIYMQKTFVIAESIPHRTVKTWKYKCVLYYFLIIKNNSDKNRSSIFYKKIRVNTDWNTIRDAKRESLSCRLFSYVRFCGSIEALNGWGWPLTWIHYPF